MIVLLVKAMCQTIPSFSYYRFLDELCIHVLEVPGLCFNIALQSPALHTVPKQPKKVLLTPSEDFQNWTVNWTTDDNEAILSYFSIAFGLSRLDRNISVETLQVDGKKVATLALLLP